MALYNVMHLFDDRILIVSVGCYYEIYWVSCESINSQLYILINAIIFVKLANRVVK